MSRTRYKQYSNGRNYEYEGNTVRRNADGYTDWQYRKVYEGGARKKNAASRVWSAFLILLGIACAVGVLTVYVSLRSKVISVKKELASLESELNDLTQENDDRYNEVIGSIDYEAIKEKALEYGMKYANTDQIITYSDDGGDDYVRQQKEIPNE